MQLLKIHPKPSTLLISSPEVLQTAQMALMFVATMDMGGPIKWVDLLSEWHPMASQYQQ